MGPERTTPIQRGRTYSEWVPRDPVRIRRGDLIQSGSRETHSGSEGGGGGACQSGCSAARPAPVRVLALLEGEAVPTAVHLLSPIGPRRRQSRRGLPGIIPFSTCRARWYAGGSGALPMWCKGGIQAGTPTLRSRLLKSPTPSNSASRSAERPPAIGNFPHCAIGDFPHSAIGSFPHNAIGKIPVGFKKNYCSRVQSPKHPDIFYLFYKR